MPDGRQRVLKRTLFHRAVSTHRWMINECTSQIAPVTMDLNGSLHRVSRPKRQCSSKRCINETLRTLCIGARALMLCYSRSWYLRPILNGLCMHQCSSCVSPDCRTCSVPHGARTSFPATQSAWLCTRVYSYAMAQLVSVLVRRISHPLKHLAFPPSCLIQLMC